MSARIGLTRANASAQPMVSKCHLLSPNVTSTSRNERHEAKAISATRRRADVAERLALSPNDTSTSQGAQSKATGLSPRQVLAARMMGRGMGVVGVARRLGIHRRTVARWKLRPDFREEVRRALDSVVSPVRRPIPAAQVWEFEGVKYQTAEEYLAAVSAARPI